MGAGNAEIVFVYVIGTLGMVLLAMTIFFFFVTYQKRMLRKQVELNQVKSDHQQEILQNTIVAQEIERKRIAQDLHDEVGAMLSLVKLNVARIEKNTEEEKPKNIAGETKSHLDDVIAQVRRISRSLLPPALSNKGLYGALEEFVNWVDKSDDLKIVCRKSGEQFRFDPGKELAFFRILQELLNNALKHSKADMIRFQVRFTDKYLAVLMTDNGVGFDVEEKRNTGLGLRNLESRTLILGAELRMRSQPGKGTGAFICMRIG